MSDLFFFFLSNELKKPVCLCCNYFSLSIISAVSDFTVPFIRKLYPQLFSGFNYQINDSIYKSISDISFLDVLIYMWSLYFPLHV